MLKLGPVSVGYGKDGGPESHVYGLFFECKSLFSLVLLRFNPGSRQAYHSHAFDAWSVLLRGKLVEKYLGCGVRTHVAPCYIGTPRKTFHKVTSIGTSWVLSLRGPWQSTWNEYTRERGLVTLGHGRKEVWP